MDVKQRRSPVLLAAGGLALLLVAAAIALVVVFARPVFYLGGDVPAVDYRAEFNRLALKSAGVDRPEENNWDLLEKILEQVIEVDAALGAEMSDGRAPYSSGDHPDATEREHRLAHARLAGLEQRGVFEMLDALAEDSGAALLYPDIGLPMMDMIGPHLPEARQLARAIVLRIRVTMAGEDPEEAVRSVRHGLALVQIVGQQPTLIDRLTAIALSSLVNLTVREALLEESFDASTLEAMLAAHRQYQLPPMTVTMEGERLIGQEALYRSLGRTPIRPMNRSAQMARHNEFFEKLDVYISAIPNDRDPGLRAELEAMQSTGWMYAPLDLLLPSISGAVRSDDLHLCSYHGTQVMLAVEAYRARHGRVPRKLSELVPELLPEIPADPLFSDGFRYVLIDPEEDELGREYLLYTVGADGTDDEGKQAPMPWEAMSERAPGTDYVFNAPE